MLDSLTPAGERFLKSENDVARRIAFHYGYKLGLTIPQCLIDAVFIGEFEGEPIIHTAEIKSRQFELIKEDGNKKLRDNKQRVFDSYMISASKIDAGLQQANFYSRNEQGKSSFFVFVHLMDNEPDYIMGARITNELNKSLQRTERTTQASVNGGLKKDTVVFIPLDNFKIIREFADHVGN